MATTTATTDTAIDTTGTTGTIETAMAATTYRGNCHCGDFVFEFTPAAGTIVKGHRCDCSICTRKSYTFTLMRTKDDGKFTMVKGRIDDMTSYEFGRLKYVHKFCPRCGSALLVQAKETTLLYMGINIRCLQGPITSAPLETSLFAGTALPPKFEEHEFVGPEPTGGPSGDEKAKTYYGSCHCGAVRLALRSKPLELFDTSLPTERLIRCNCSICMRMGSVWCYPKDDQLSFQGLENTSLYAFGQRMNTKVFCKTCGVYICCKPNSFTPEELAQLPEVARSPQAEALRQKFQGHMAINLNILRDLKLEELPIVPLDGASFFTGETPYIDP